MTQGEQAEQLIREGWRNVDIARELGITDKYVSRIRNSGGYESMLKERRATWNRWARQTGLSSGKHKGSKRSFVYDSSAICAVVDSGVTYREAAMMFNVTRNVVAGVMNRRIEARAA